MTQCRFHIDVIPEIENQEELVFNFFDTHPQIEMGMYELELSTEKKKWHYQGWFIMKQGYTTKKFRDNMKSKKCVKKGLFSVGETWTDEYPNQLKLPYKEYFKRYTVKGDIKWTKNIPYEDLELWIKEWKSIDHTKQETLVKDKKTKKLNINQSLIAFVEAKLENRVSKKLDIDQLFDLLIDWFGKSAKDLDDFIIIRKLNMLHLHFEKLQWVELNKKRLLDKYQNLNIY